MELLGHMVVLFLMFWTTSILPCTVAVPGYHPTRSAWGFPFLFLMFLPTLVIYYYFFFIILSKNVKVLPSLELSIQSIRTQKQHWRGWKVALESVIAQLFAASTLHTQCNCGLAGQIWMPFFSVHHSSSQSDVFTFPRTFFF